MMVGLMMACGVWVAGLGSVAGVVAADRSEPKPPLPLSPSASVRQLRLPEGFRIELVASEPLVVEPSCVAFDERGRMFVSEIHGFNLEGEIDVAELNKSGTVDRSVRRIRWERVGGRIAEQAKQGQFGTIKLLVDSDGDGRMDKAHVWADRLPPCYGMLPLRDGLLVVCAPDIVFLADRDGDGRAEILVTRSDYGSGAGHMALALRKGRLIQKAKGATIGLGNRWSHLLGAFDLGAGGKSILAIETPHLAGYLLAFEMKGGRLAERARRPGFTTHSIGSRNVWEFAVIRRAGAADTVVQEVSRGRLAALALRKNRWVIRWTIPLAGPVQSNIVAADLNGDGLDDLAFAGPGGKVHALLSR